MMSCAVLRGSVEVEGVTGATHGGKQPQNSHRGNSVPTLGGRGHWTTLLLLLYTADGWVGGGRGAVWGRMLGCFGGHLPIIDWVEKWKRTQLMHSTSRRLIIGLLAVIHTLLIFVVDHQGHWRIKKVFLKRQIVLIIHTMTSSDIAMQWSPPVAFRHRQSLLKAGSKKYPFS